MRSTICSIALIIMAYLYGRHDERDRLRMAHEEAERRRKRAMYYEFTGQEEPTEVLLDALGRPPADKHP